MTSIQRQKYLKVNPHPFKGHLFCFSNKIVDVAQDGDDGYSVLLGVNSSRYEDDLYYLFVNFKSRNPAAGDLNKGQMIWVRGYAAKLERESDRVELEDRSYKIYQFTLTVKDFRWGVIGGVGIFN